MNMFIVDEYCEKIRKEKSETFLKLVVNMLFAIKIARQDTGTAISCLETIVREPDQINWMKMVYLFKYIIGTKYVPLILSAENSGMLEWYIDGSH